MKILKSKPCDDGFFMPAEFSKHIGCIMIWPHRRDSWAYGGYEAQKYFIEIAKIIAESEKLTVFCPDSAYDEARHKLPENIQVSTLITDDSWARDIAPIFLKNKYGDMRGVDFGFNAWGGLYDGLYFPWDNDNKAARKICDFFDVDCYNVRSFIMEGGAVHSDGCGTLLVTDECIESSGRNPSISKDEKDAILMQTLGAKKVLHLPFGIYNDETNGHVDNIACFASPGKIIISYTEDKSDPQYERSMADIKYLENMTDAAGRKIEIIKLPLPEPIYVTKKDCEGLDINGDEKSRTPGERLAASYNNFYISNKSIVMPAFGDRNDKTAQDILQKAFPTRNVVSIYAKDILLGGGNIHCITQQIPK